MSQQRVKKALESTESLLASMLDRSSFGSASGGDGTDGEASLRESSLTPPAINVEQSLVGVGEGVVMAQVSARQEIPSPSHLMVEDSFVADPLTSLTAMVTRSLVAGDQVTDPHLLQEQLRQREKELEVTAKLGLGLLNRNELLQKELSRLMEQVSSVEGRLSQARHELSRKDSLLKLYYVEEEQKEDEQEAEQRPPEWVQRLSEENTQLKKENQELWEKNFDLEQESGKNAQKERAFVQQCFEQLSEAKQQLEELQNDMDGRETEHCALQDKYEACQKQNQLLAKDKESLITEMEEMKERVMECQYTVSHLSAELIDCQEKYETCYSLMEDAREEVRTLKELSSLSPSNSQTANNSSESSIVQEIEEVLRQEIMAATTLTERPPSPDNYARQRTMVVMETVKAATLATAKRLEKLATEQRKKEEIATSPKHTTFIDPSELTPEDIAKGRQTYFSPQKLQIVKPMEGSMTLLRWKLLATPELGGPSSFFSDKDRPGVHLKDLGQSSRPGSSMQTLSPDGMGDKRWHSVADLRHTSVRESPLVAGRSLNKKPPTKDSSSTPTDSPVSTVSQVKRNIWNLFSPRAKKNIINESPNEPSSSSGLQELLG